MTDQRVLGGLLFSILLTAATSRAYGADVPEEKPAPESKAVPERKAEPDAKAVREAKDRYARGLHLFENGDNAGALADFERANEILPSRLLAYRIAMVYVAMDKPVDAVDSLEEVLSASGPLKPEYLARAQAAKAEMKNRLGELDVKVNVPASIEIDGARAGEAPLQGPLAVAAGEHFVAVVAPGHVPGRQTVSVAAHGRAELSFELQPTEEKLAHVTVHSPLLGAEVRLDDELIGKTPLAEPVAVLPGKHVFELQRPGYMSAHRGLNIAGGVYATVAFDPDEESGGGAPRGRLRIATDAGDVAVTIDGHERGRYRAPIQLPAGLHVVKMEQRAFEPMERIVDIPAGGDADVKVSLRPTGKVRAAQVSSSHTYKTWAIAAIVSGALIAGGSTALAVWSNSKLPPAEDGLTLARKDTAPGGSCDPSQVANPVQKKLCDQTMNDAQNRVDKYRNLRLGGIVGAGAGAAVAGAGIVMLLVAPAEPAKDEPDELLAGGLVPVISAGPGGAGLWLRGQF